jgi:hypothetical protein
VAGLGDRPGGFHAGTHVKYTSPKHSNILTLVDTVAYAIVFCHRWFASVSRCGRFIEAIEITSKQSPLRQGYQFLFHTLFGSQDHASATRPTNTLNIHNCIQARTIPLCIFRNLNRISKLSGIDCIRFAEDLLHYASRTTILCLRIELWRCVSRDHH